MLAALAFLVCGQQPRVLTVFAAASLNEPLTAIARSYEQTHHGVSVKLNFGGSQTLAAQINHGAPADVFASAARKNLSDVAYDKVSFRVFVLNKLAIVVRKGFLGVGSVRDLAKAPNLVVADPSVPVGRYTESFFAKAAKLYGASWQSVIRSHIVSHEVDVKAVLAKVRLGEADAGIVYVSDITTAGGQIGSVPIPDNLNEIAEYPVAIPSGAINTDDAKHFIKSLMDADSQKLFAQDGFISITTPTRSLAIVSNKGVRVVLLPLSARFQTIKVAVTNEKQQTLSFSGVPLGTLLPSGNSRLRVVGADHYSQEFSLADLRRRQAILFTNGDGNYQLIVPGLKPSTWVQWIRSIELR